MEIITNRIAKKVLLPKKLYASEAEKIQIPNPITIEIATNKGTSIFPLSILELASGLYHIIIHSNAGITHEKFIKQ